MDLVELVGWQEEALGQLEEVQEELGAVLGQLEAAQEELEAVLGQLEEVLEEQVWYLVLVDLVE